MKPILPVTLKDVITEWWKSSQLKDHFYLRDDSFGFHMNCKCPIGLDGINRDMEYSGVTFVWFQDGKVLTRPDEFWMAHGPIESLTIKDPDFFQKLEAHTNMLHDFFKTNRNIFFGR